MYLYLIKKMFLSKILLNKKLQKNKIKFYLQIKILLKKLFFKIIFLKKTDTYKLLLNELNKYKLLKKNLIDSNKNNLDVNKLVNYILIINMSLTNTMVHLTNTKGKLLVSLSAGQLNFKGKQKRKQPSVLIMLLKELLIKTRFVKNKTIAVHFKNTKEYHESLVISMLKEKFFIQFIKSYNLLPHNGCRPKKLKRLKSKKR